ncbi:MAG: glycosyltransferase family protein [Phycisphaerales bacterium]
MARSIYGVAGEGFGHSSRSHLSGQYRIEKGHEVLVAASRRSLSYLRKHFGGRVHEIAGLSLVYQDGNLLPIKTFTANLSRVLSNRRTNRELYRTVFDPFCPELAISDCEPFNARWAWRHGIPFLSIDHQHLLTMCEPEHPPDEWIPRFNAESATRCHYTGAAAYVILGFFLVPTKNASAVLAPPVVRPIVSSFEPTCGDHIVLYTTDGSWQDKLVSILNSFHEFRIYGFDENRRFGNCRFKQTSTEEFMGDSARCRGVIATAGFSLLSECLYFRKKMLLLPVQGQCEQIVNATYAEKLGLALNRASLKAQTLIEYWDALHTPTADCDDILWPDNRAFCSILNQTLDSVSPQARAIRARRTPSSTMPRTAARGWQPCHDDTRVA